MSDVDAAAGPPAGAPAPVAPLFDVDGLSVVLPTPHGPLRAVDGVSLRVRAGLTLGIVGESGSGKSMLVRGAIGLVGRGTEVSGRVVFDGRNLSEMGERQRREVWGRDIAMVFQNPLTSLNPVRRIGDQLADPLRRHLHLTRRQARRRCSELLATVHLPDPERQLRRFPHELSGGMRQRVIIAGALACGPRLLIADEPTTALDVTVQRQILDLMDVLQRDSGMGTVLITHDLAVVAGRADDVAVMYAGRIVEEGSTEQVFRHTAHPYTQALHDAIPDLERPSHEELRAIPGRPPDLTRPVVGCPFAPRCPLRQERCTVEAPLLRGIGEGHRVACHFPLTVHGGLG